MDCGQTPGQKAAATLGGLDILVNNAAIARYAPFAEISQEDVDGGALT